jgi:hypothetical protein
MKKLRMMFWAIVVSVGMLIILVGCKDSTPPVPVVEPPTYRSFNTTNWKGQAYWAYSIKVVDGCEYVCSGVHGFAHKGNCTNQVHIYNK